MSSNRLSLNASRTQLILPGTRQQLLKLISLFSLSGFLCLLVSWLGCHSLQHSFVCDHIYDLSCTSFYRLRPPRAVRRSVPSSTLSSMVQAFICSRIDYCNSFLLPKSRLSPLHSVHNEAAASSPLFRVIPLLRLSYLSNYTGFPLRPVFNL